MSAVKPKTLTPTRRKPKKSSLTIFDLIDIKTLAEYLGWQSEGEIEVFEPRVWRHPVKVKRPALEVAATRFSEYRTQLALDFERHNPYRKTWGQLVDEALRTEFGIKHGKSHEKIQLAIDLRPDLYSRNPS